MNRLSEMFNVNHFIVSQVNPHVVPFLSDHSYDTPPLTGQLATWGKTAARLAISEGMHRMSMLAEVGVLRTPLTKLKSILTQRYSGDITILPEICYSDVQRMLTNPTPEFMVNASLCGQRATWPKISRIQSHCSIELALDRAIAQLRTKVVFSPSQSNLRQLNPVQRAKRRRTKTGDGWNSSQMLQSRSYSYTGPRSIGLRTRSSSKAGSESSFGTVPPRICLPECAEAGIGDRGDFGRSQDQSDGDYQDPSAIGGKGTQNSISLLMTPTIHLAPPNAMLRRQSDGCLRPFYG